MMTDEPADKPSKLRSVAVLPWTVAIVLFLVLADLLGLAAVGFTTVPYAEPETPAEMAPAETAQPASPDMSEPAEVGERALTEPDPEDAPSVSPDNDATPTSEPAATPGPVGPSDAIPDADVPLDAPPPVPGTEQPALRDGGLDPDEPQPAGPEPAADTSDETGSQGDTSEGLTDRSSDAIATATPVVPEPETAPIPESDTKPGMEPVLPPSPLMIPRAQRGGLLPAPDPGLVESSPLGPLPRIGPDGREPWKVYARPFDERDDRPRVAIILSGLGLSSAATEAAIQDLPGEVTLAFQPFADNIQQWIRLSRAAGHEVLLNLPMEPVDFPANDPGPRALFVTLSPDENQDRMRWALSRVSGYVGVVNHMGSRFTTSRESMQPILAELKARGLLFVDARSAARSVATVLASEMEVPRAINDRFLDNREVSRATVDARLAEVERIAKDAGVSIAIGQAFPVTLERVRAWAATLEGKGIALVPISAVVDQQSDR
jgi:polysaccharide deacetylase 2 family uncharacterized protein YibQ